MGARGFLRARGDHSEPVVPRSSGVSARARMSPASFRRCSFLPLYNAQGALRTFDTSFLQYAYLRLKFTLA